MVQKAKAASAVGLSLAALIAGVFFSSCLVVLLLGLHDVPVGLDTYWGYARALDIPQVAPFATKIKLAGALGFGLPLLLWLAPTFALFKPLKQSIHGDARFATRADPKKAGLLDARPKA